jgi:hypothetical protein
MMSPAMMQGNQGADAICPKYCPKYCCLHNLTVSILSLWCPGSDRNKGVSSALNFIASQSRSRVDSLSCSMAASLSLLIVLLKGCLIIMLDCGFIVIVFDRGLLIVMLKGC